MAIASGASRGLAYGVQTARGTAATTTTLLRTAGAGQDLKNNQNHKFNSNLNLLLLMLKPKSGQNKTTGLEKILLRLLLL